MSHVSFLFVKKKKTMVPRNASLMQKNVVICIGPELDKNDDACNYTDTIFTYFSVVAFGFVFLLITITSLLNYFIVKSILFNPFPFRI